MYLQILTWSPPVSKLNSWLCLLNWKPWCCTSYWCFYGTDKPKCKQIVIILTCKGTFQHPHQGKGLQWRLVHTAQIQPFHVQSHINCQWSFGVINTLLCKCLPKKVVLKALFYYHFFSQTHVNTDAHTTSLKETARSTDTVRRLVQTLFCGSLHVSPCYSLGDSHCVFCGWGTAAPL